MIVKSEREIFELLGFPYVSRSALPPRSSTAYHLPYPLQLKPEDREYSTWKTKYEKAGKWRLTLSQLSAADLRDRSFPRHRHLVRREGVIASAIYLDFIVFCFSACSTTFLSTAIPCTNTKPRQPSRLHNRETKNPKQTNLALPHPVHVLPRNVFSVGLLAQIFELFLGRRNPEGVLVEGLVTVEDELRTRSARGSRADLCERKEVQFKAAKEVRMRGRTVGETETLDDGEKSADGEEGGALLHLFRDDTSLPLRHNAVNFAEDLTCRQTYVKSSS